MSSYTQFVDNLHAYGFNFTGLDSMLQGQISPEPGMEYAFQFIVENQRGMKVFGIPMFNGKSLIPGIDPPPYLRVDGTRVNLSDNTIENYPLPDLNWRWAWELWYVLMLNDVDESGWLYLSVFFRKGLHWHGKCFVGNFVRRRLWLRMRVRKVEEPDTPKLSLSDSCTEVSHQASISSRPPPSRPLIQGATFA